MSHEAALWAGRFFREIMQKVTASDDPGDASDVIAALTLEELAMLSQILPALAGEVNTALRKHLRDLN